MKKPRNLINLIINEVSLVDHGANKRDFFMTKNKEKQMNKNLALKLLKAEDLSPEDQDDILKSLSSEDRLEVEEVLKDVDSIGDSVLSKELQKSLELHFEKAGSKFSKATMDSLKAVETALKALTEKVSAIVGTVKPEPAEKEKELTDDEVKKIMEETQAEVFKEAGFNLNENEEK